MKIRETELAGVVLIQPDVFQDQRGYFQETFNLARYEEALGQTLGFVQDNASKSTRGVLRGMHFQITKPQAKLVRVVQGKVFDVAVDIDPKSSTFGQWVGVELSEENKHQLFIPKGYAHGFQVLSQEAIFEYKCIGYYEPSDEGGVHWNDPDISINWPLDNPIVSAKDQQLSSIASLAS